MVGHSPADDNAGTRPVRAGTRELVAAFDAAHVAQFGFRSTQPLIVDRLVADAVAASEHRLPPCAID